MSLYRELITDAIWAYQRDNYGYQNLRSFPLLVSFHGLPYIDVRVSFNSFVPRDVPSDLAGRLVNYYIDRLLAEPQLHDKVEFEIIFSCYTLDLPTADGQARRAADFLADDRASSTGALRRLTNRIIHGETALWRRDRAKIDLLAQRLPMICNAKIDKISRIYWLIEDCKRYGTLPFAGLARAGFIAVQLLQSFVAVGVLNAEEHATFMASVDTVGSRIGHDFAHLTKAEFLARYGHLRPGTYDILSPRYDEAPDLYFDWSAARASTSAPQPRFTLSIEQLRHIEQLLKEHELDIDVLSLIEFIKAGIEGREYAKFVFTRSLSDALVADPAAGRGIRPFDRGLRVSGLRRHPHALQRERLGARSPAREHRARQGAACAHAQARAAAGHRLARGGVCVPPSPEPAEFHHAQEHHRAGRLGQRSAGELRGSDPVRAERGPRASTGYSRAVSADSSPSSAAPIRTWRSGRASSAFRRSSAPAKRCISAGRRRRSCAWTAAIRKSR